MTLNVSHPINPKISEVVFASRTQSQDHISPRTSWAPPGPGWFSVNSSLTLTRVCLARDAIGARRACVFLAAPQGPHTWKRELTLQAVSLGARHSVLGGRWCPRQHGVFGARWSTRKKQPPLPVRSPCLWTRTAAPQLAYQPLALSMIKSTLRGYTPKKRSILMGPR